MKNKAIFLDRDGIINVRLIDEYVKNIDEFVFENLIFDILKFLKEKEYLLILITNQQGVGKNLMSLDELTKIHKYMQEMFFINSGFELDDIFFCTDLKNSGSLRRKPAPGMILEAIEKWNINPSESYMIGDSISDVIAGKKAGTKTILLGKFDITKEIKDYTDIIVQDHSELLKIIQLI
jgi:D-glycero-D-manno-heptose 1,7-bisphosphate phosphatase